MKLKEKTLKELETKLEELESKIAKNGVGSEYLSKAERIQRDVNIALMLCGATAILGVTAWTVYKFRGE